MTAKSAKSVFLSIATTTVLALSVFNLYIFLQRQSSQEKVLGTKTDTSSWQKEMEFWKEIVQQNPSYRDGWTELSKIQCELGEINACLESFEKARTIDPNYSY